MISVYALKPAFQGFLRPIVIRLAAWGVTANQVTVLTCVLSVLLGLDLTFGKQQWILLPIFLFLRMALNAIDGMLAHEHNQQTPLGALLNELTDVIADAALTLPFAYLPGWNVFWIGCTIFLSALTEMAGVLALAIGARRRYDGPFGKSDRALVFGVLGFWLAMRWPMPESAGVWIPPLLAGLCCVTILNRVQAALKSALL